jgi:hypothetical protein
MPDDTSTGDLAPAKLRAGCYWLIAFLFSLGTLTGCLDSWSRKSISADYYLERLDTLYYLQRKGHEVDGVGLVEGTVERVGRSGTIILVLRHACFRGDPDGWMVIDTKSHKVAGPISDSERQTQFPAIVCYPVHEAWKKL